MKKVENKTIILVVSILAFVIIVGIVFYSTERIVEKLTPGACEDNPREDGDCFCEKYIDTGTVIGSHGENCRKVTITRCDVKGLYNYGQELEIKGTRYIGYCDVDYIDDRITSFKNVTIINFKENITNCDLVYDYEQTCLKARPKTECEKENSDYVTETKEWLVIWEDWMDERPENFTETTYREKNEVEKLMDKSCDELFADIIRYSDNYDIPETFNCYLIAECERYRGSSSHLNDLKQAWRQHINEDGTVGCEI